MNSWEMVLDGTFNKNEQGKKMGKIKEYYIFDKGEDSKIIIVCEHDTLEMGITKYEDGAIVVGAKHCNPENIKGYDFKHVLNEEAYILEADVFTSEGYVKMSNMSNACIEIERNIDLLDTEGYEATYKNIIFKYSTN